MKKLSGGELLVECLIRQGIKHFFSIAGGQLGTVYDAIGNSRDMDIFVPRCETAVPLMACGYTASSGLPCVSSTTVGAGVVYEVAGLLKAWLNYIPVISIAPQVQSYKMKPHQENLQACNQDEIFHPVTKWNTIVYHWDRIPQMTNRALREALSGTPGPVHLDLPVDVLFGRKWLTGRKERRIMPDPAMTRFIGSIPGDAGAIAKAVEAVRGSKKPVVIVGQGVGREGRYRNIKTVLNDLGIPAVATPPSFGFMCGKDLSNAGYTGNYDGTGALDEADLLIIAGLDRHGIDALASLKDSSKPVIQIETDPKALITGRKMLIGLYADPMSALSKIRDGRKIGGDAFLSWRQEFIKAGESADGVEGAVARKLAQASTEKDIIIADGERSVKAATAVLGKAVYRDLFVMDDRDIRGAGLPYAIGAAIANPSCRVTLLCDKNSLFYHVRELQPAVSEGLDFTILCIDSEADEDNVCDTGLVLEGLGCDVAAFDPEKTSPGDLFKHRPGAPGGYICR